MSENNKKAPDGFDPFRLPKKSFPGIEYTVRQDPTYTENGPLDMKEEGEPGMYHRSGEE